jgi:hypothetical protein
VILKINILDNINAQVVSMSSPSGSTQDEQLPPQFPWNFSKQWLQRSLCNPCFFFQHLSCTKHNEPLFLAL